MTNGYLIVIVQFVGLNMYNQSVTRTVDYIKLKWLIGTRCGLDSTGSGSSYGYRMSL